MAPATRQSRELPRMTGWVRATATVFLALLALAIWQHRDPRDPSQPPKRTWSFPAEGIHELTVHSARTALARSREESSDRPSIAVSARPRLLPNRYHREGAGPAARNLTWVLERVGLKVDLRSLGEGTSADGRFVLDELEIQVPPGTVVHFEAQAPSKE